MGALLPGTGLAMVMSVQVWCAYAVCLGVCVGVCDSRLQGGNLSATMSAYQGIGGPSYGQLLPQTLQF